LKKKRVSGSRKQPKKRVSGSGKPGLETLFAMARTMRLVFNAGPMQ